MADFKCWSCKSALVTLDAKCPRCGADPMEMARLTDKVALKTAALGIALALLLGGCEMGPMYTQKKVVQIGECEPSPRRWGCIGGLRNCAVKYEDGTGGQRCGPILGASYSVAVE